MQDVYSASFLCLSWYLPYARPHCRTTSPINTICASATASPQAARSQRMAQRPITTKIPTTTPQSIIPTTSTTAMTTPQYLRHTTASLQTRLTQSFCSTPAAVCAPLSSDIFSKVFTTITTRPALGATPISTPTATEHLRSPILTLSTQW